MRRQPGAMDDTIGGVLDRMHDPERLRAHQSAVGSSPSSGSKQFRLISSFFS
jgi:hypothetical protein